MKTTAKSLVMKPMFRLRVELDKKKEAKYNPPNFDDIEDMEDTSPCNKDNCEFYKDNYVEGLK